MWKSHIILWPSSCTNDLQNVIRSGHYHYQCMYKIWEQSIPLFLSCNTTHPLWEWQALVYGRWPGQLQHKTIIKPWSFRYWGLDVCRGWLIWIHQNGKFHGIPSELFDSKCAETCKLFECTNKRMDRKMDGEIDKWAAKISTDAPLTW